MTGINHKKPRMRKPKPIEAWDEKLAVLAAYKNADPALQ